MFWKKKEDEKSLPDLPPLKPVFPAPSASEEQLKENDDEDMDDDAPVERHNLPSFPDSPISKGFSQAAIKDAVEKNEEEQMIPVERSFKTIEMDNELSKPSFLPPPENTSQSMRKAMATESKSKEVFVKIEKFHSARKSLAMAEAQVGDIESLLRKVREVRLREEQELTAWEKDISSVKSRIEEVSKNLFDKL